MVKKWMQFTLCSLLIGSMNHAIAQPLYSYTPNLPSSNEFAASVLWLRPGGSNDYAVLVSPFNAAVSVPILSPSWEPEGMNPHFGGSFSVNFKHVFCGTGNDINLYWAHLRTSDNASFPVDRSPQPAEQMTGPFFDIGPDAGDTSAATGQLTNHYDVLNLELGKQIHFVPDVNLRFFAGVSGLWLQQTTEADFSGTTGSGPFTFDTTTEAKFSAAGMRFGINGEYQAWHGLKAVGLLAGNLYIGRQQPSIETSGTSGVLTAAGIPVNYQSITHQRYIQMVPGLDAKLGLKYAWECPNNRAFIIEAGYMASIYINSRQNYEPTTTVPGSAGIDSGSIFLQSLLKTTDSFSVDGPYVTFAIR